MQIDRSAFLAFASAIASCTPQQQTQPAAPPPQPTATVQPVDPPPPTSIGEAQHPPPSKEGYWPAGEGYWPAGEGYYPPPAPTPAPPPFNANVCSGDDIGSPGSCAGLNFAKSCAPFPFVTDACNDAVKYYKPKIAERAVACIRKLSPNQLCDALTTYHCKDAALRSACIDPSADSACNSIVAKCPSAKMDECRGYLSGMNDVGRAEMVKCMIGPNGCGFGLYSCTEGL